MALETTHTFRQCNFERTGKCDQCIGCEHDCEECPHGERRGSKMYCKVYDTRGDVCEYCTNTEGSIFYNNGKDVTHQTCVDHPAHPNLYVIKNDICAYKFEPVTQDDADKFDEINAEVKHI